MEAFYEKIVPCACPCFCTGLHICNGSVCNRDDNKSLRIFKYFLNKPICKYCRFQRINIFFFQLIDGKQYNPVYSDEPLCSIWCVEQFKYEQCGFGSV